MTLACSISVFVSTKGKKSESVKEPSAQETGASSSFQNVDVATSNYGVAAVKIASQGSKKIYTPEQVEKILKNKEDNWYKQPQNVDAVYLNPVTGQYTNEENGSLFYFLKGTEPLN